MNFHHQPGPSQNAFDKTTMWVEGEGGHSEKLPHPYQTTPYYTLIFNNTIEFSPLPIYLLRMTASKITPKRNSSSTGSVSVAPLIQQVCGINMQLFQKI